MKFTQEELQLLYAACMSYGDKLSEIVKSIPNEGDTMNESPNPPALLGRME